MLFMVIMYPKLYDNIDKIVCEGSPRQGSNPMSKSKPKIYEESAWRAQTRMYQGKYNSSGVFGEGKE